ncbi:serine proteinase stubble [Zootermopsis nevadensis]|uniref:Serine proteinase stubble n=1 Tax=Zootermopsis nevadensis TaxID=136037 RepID=A0A067RTK0_ZOONE|nr:serine proteinase stubble [Zootermopsis nevadensis]XP_021919464.1 serine proteinase stubble [Zootermopsis nevadensis]XP_021919472.1 serine proteinase stubble [Zootermopsis nevadensis]XP_021919482.1 serine proteinase stubble [Zootermopsis nevadensis]XP_021919490.1 serine proteinase stubble [Zootermopsis nevadensis]XP_021919500.1 serine proteinase stubble [Zootermopsis nevadensis]XP_021919510.1 serine proteinase stubble [Zootermopsis nevadensis]XP_021919520.1 serine proteinase stubble [Zoot
MAQSGAALLLLLLYCFWATGDYQDPVDSRKLFGGYRIVPKPCRPDSDAHSENLGICMFNYECAAREGEVVGACMDGFLFGACCRLPPGQTFELPDTDLLLDNVANFPPDNPNSIVATSKRPDYMESSSINELLHNPFLHVSAHPDADTVLLTGGLDHPVAETNRPSSGTTLQPDLSTFSYVQSNSVDEQPSTPKYHPEEKSTMSVTPTYYSTASKWATSFRPHPTPSHEYDEGLILVPTITKRPESIPNPESINHIISLLNDTGGGLVDPGPEPEPEIISLGNSSPAGLSTWVAVNGKPSPSTSWKPDTTGYSKPPQSHTTLWPGLSSGSTSSHHVVGPSFDVFTTQQGTSRPAPTVIVLGPFSSDVTTTATSSTKWPAIITSSNKISSTTSTLVTKRPSTVKPSTGFFITKQPSSTTPNLITSRPSSTQFTNRPTTHYSDLSTAQFTFRPTLSITQSTNRPSPVPTHFTDRPNLGTSSFTIRPTSSITQVTSSRPSTGTIFVTNSPGVTNRPTSGTTIVSNLPWVTTPIDYPETTLGADHLANFPPVRNPSFNMTQHERPPVVLPPNPEDLFNVDDIPTPMFVEDDKLNNKLQTFVDKIVLSLDGNFQDLEEVLHSGKNVTTTSITTTRRPPTSKRPTQVTTTRRPTVTGLTPVQKPSISTTSRPQTLRPQPTRPTLTTRPRPSPTTRPSNVRPLQTTQTNRPSTKPTQTLRPSIKPTQTLRPTTQSSRPSQTPRPRPTSIRPSQSPKPSSQQPSRPSTTYRPGNTVKVTTKRSTTTSSTTQLLLQQDDVTSTKSTTEEPTTLLDYTLTTNDEDLTTSSHPVDYKHECGVRPLMKKTGRIVGGKGATFGEWPWQVLVRESTWLGLFTKNKCGGVLITSRYVTTAAHCQPGFLANLVAVFGEFDISGELESRRSVMKNIRRVVVHRQYDAATFANDLALLELESPVAFDEHIVPICMPHDKEDFTGRMATVTGWGRLKYGGGVPNLLQEVQVPVIENSVCQEMFHTAGHSKVILNSFLCAGYANGQKDSCEGDSGGPLMLEREDGRWVLVGTVSHGIKCAAPYLPGVYMRTTYYKPWLHAITGVN